LLVATMRDCPFALFVWPANSITALEAGIAAFLQEWPASAPAPSAVPELCWYARGSRLRPDREARLSADILLPESQDHVLDSLLAQGAGSIGYLFAARAQAEAIESTSQLVDRYLAIPGTIEMDTETIVVQIAMERVDLSLRRAGPDRDPGWIPWLRKNVRFKFVDDEHSEAAGILNA
jgi:hypothetical protein